MTQAIIRVQCGRCGGSGTDDNKHDVNGDSVPESCTVCGGDGYVSSMELDITDIMDKFDDIEDKLDDMKEVVDAL
jgi:DnaJ-class molecular chaperone